MAAPRKTLRIALAQLNPTVGDVAGNAAKVREARAEAAGARRRPRHVPRALPRRLSARGSRPEAGLPGCLPPGLRGARARDRPTAGPAVLIGLPWVEDGGLYNAYALLDDGQIAARALQGRSAELRRLRREARLHAGPAARPGGDPRRAHRHAGLRGHLGRRGRRVPRRDRRPRSCSCRTARPIGAARPTSA